MGDRLSAATLALLFGHCNLLRIVGGWLLQPAIPCVLMLLMADGGRLRVQAQMQHLAQLQASQAAAEAAAAREAAAAAAAAQAQAAAQAAAVAKLRDMPQQQRMQVHPHPVGSLMQIAPSPEVTAPSRRWSSSARRWLCPLNFFSVFSFQLSQLFSAFFSPAIAGCGYCHF
jgi:hypothetical protein